MNGESVTFGWAHSSNAIHVKHNYPTRGALQVCSLLKYLYKGAGHERWLILTQAHMHTHEHKNARTRTCTCTDTDTDTHTLLSERQCRNEQTSKFTSKQPKGHLALLRQIASDAKLPTAAELPAMPTAAKALTLAPAQLASFAGTLGGLGVSFPANWRSCPIPLVSWFGLVV